MTGAPERRTRGDIWNDIERAAQATCGAAALCGECGASFASFGETCRRLDTSTEFHCEGWRRIERAYEQAEAALPAGERWALDPGPGR